ncbi:fimbrial biogenesis chaperone [Klebsiella pneumoniae]|uniref:fimbrial biogenesis chaperone n=1 Tax=Klebsiella pneumoniae TaxID=573 RepID=UPI0010EB36D3|nr:molecular chaperone [Klebsiella pneumoniae]MBW3122885.1 molecular chaperone [Klebsiella pneumoniae]MCW9194182.1 molecular chaperone [Klebsiella pneumoniae]VTN65433.1 fimbrial chaperone [Klebsiella pneumoniae]HBX7622941.1 molecular chaperone [Klebsiella pneumoniae]
MRILNSLLSIILLLSASFACYAGVQVGTTRIIYAEGKKEVSVSLDNQDITPYLIKSWIENDKNVGTHFLLTPPLSRLEGKQKNVVRIFKLDGQLPTDRESLFFFNTTSIPASSTEADRNTLQIAVRTKLKLIFRPKSLSDDVPVNHAKELSWSRSGNQVIVKNPSPFYINFMFIKVNGQSLIMKDKNFVAPFSSASYALPSTNGGKVEWKIINDMGGQSDLYQSSL